MEYQISECILRFDISGYNISSDKTQAMIYTKKIVFKNIKDFNPVHTFECGQVFRWVPETQGRRVEDGNCEKDKAGTKSISSIKSEGCGNNSKGKCVYIGFAGAYAARVIYEVESPSNAIAQCKGTGCGTLTIETSGGSREFWYDYFDLGTDYGEIKKTLTDSEPAIEAATDYGGGIRILNQDLFETIISFIISQNNNIPRIRKCIDALCAKYGEPIAGDNTDETAGYAFPTPEALANADIEDLAALKLGYRNAYIKESARMYLEHGCPSRREDLLAMHGIGPKVANCIMLFGLKDVAAFPIDTWVRHIMNDMYGFDEKDIKGMQSFAAEKFGSYAGYAQQYLFYYYRDKALSS